MASTFAAISSLGSPTVLDKSNKLSSFASISSSSLGRTQYVRPRRTPCVKVNAMAKELYFNKDGSAIKKLQVSLFL